MSKKIILVDGGKGGVGKSMVASVIVDNLLSRDQKPMVVEADAAVPDVAQRYHGQTHVASAPLGGDGVAEDRVIEVFSSILDVPADLVIVNLPSGAGEVIDGRAELIGEAIHDAGAELIHVWVVGRDDASAQLAEASIAGGIASIATHRVVVVNAHHGDAERFPWVSSQARRAWLEAGAVECILPRLPAAVRDSVPGPFREALPSLNAIQRASLRLWLRDADVIADAVMGHGE